MIQRVSRYIAKHSLLDRTKKHLVALSGGADSVCLLLMLKDMGYDIDAVHCNFHLRGEESDRDEDFCKQLCKDNGIELHLTHFDTKAYASLHKVSIEMAARELRYGYFERLRVAMDAESIVVAHHRDDNVETFLMNIIRGTGIHGLSAIKPRNGRIIRPLLCLSRQEIEDFLTLRGQDYVTDSTNLVDDVTRNKIRLNILPMLESINPAARENINRTIEHVAQATCLIDNTVTETIPLVLRMEGDAVHINREKLLHQPSPEYILHEILSQYGFSPSQTEQIFGNITAQSGRVWTSSTHVLATDRDDLVIESVDECEKEGKQLVIPETGIYIYNERAKIGVKSESRTEEFMPSKEKNIVTLDADKVSFPLTLRKTRQGDRFHPFGMKGSKLVSDYLTDRKRNHFDRQRQLVVCDANGTIVWLVGERSSQKASCTAETIKILTLRYIINEE